MHETQELLQDQLAGRYAVWFVRGSWWAVSLEADETVVVPDGPPPLIPPGLN